MDPLYVALYKECTPFQWVHFTPHGVIRGAMSPSWYGWRPWLPCGIRVNP